ncbi:MAG: fused MFS/spermidine synthase, partial [Lentimicrobium sp.]|nr:fused MFS/spermidine synthase [Lentimicrobium sp.]
MNKINRGILPVLFIVFFAGFTFLIYEVSWFRMLSLVLGATVSASTIVLVAFMAGFGAGAWYWGKLTSEKQNPEKRLILLLSVTGILGVLNYFVISNLLPELYSTLQNSGMSAPISNLLVYGISLFLLLVSAFFMGGVLPVASAMIIRTDIAIASLMGKIYAWETLGSTLGGLATGFILLGTFGQQFTILIAVF